MSAVPPQRSASLRACARAKGAAARRGSVRKERRTGGAAAGERLGDAQHRRHPPRPRRHCRIAPRPRPHRRFRLWARRRRRHSGKGPSAPPPQRAGEVEAADKSDGRGGGGLRQIGAAAGAVGVGAAGWGGARGPGGQRAREAEAGADHGVELVLPGPQTRLVQFAAVLVSAKAAICGSLPCLPTRLVRRARRLRCAALLGGCEAVCASECG